MYLLILTPWLSFSFFNAEVYMPVICRVIHQQPAAHKCAFHFFPQPIGWEPDNKGLI